MSDPARIHVPDRPSWHCAGCGKPWPCASKRRRLLAEYIDAPATLRVVMTMRLADAAGDLPGVPAGELHARFLDWIPKD